MVKIRAVFEKKGRAKYISHLDLNRCMQRTFKRSGLPVWYTEGFNPHIYITFALPLSLGSEGLCEIMDFNLTKETPFEEIVSKLNAVMPSGLRVTGAYSPKTKHTAIKSAEYRLYLKGDAEELKREFEEFMSQKKINAVKRTKKGGEKLIDLKPDADIRETEAENGTLKIVLRLPAGNEKNLNPSLLMDVFSKCAKTPYELVLTQRTGIFFENGKEFF